MVLEEPSAEHIRMALRAATGRWVIGPGGPLEVNRDAMHAGLVRVGIICPYLDPQRRPGKSRWGLTDEGERWLIGQIGAAIADFAARFASLRDPAVVAPQLADELRRRFGYAVPPILFMRYDGHGRAVTPGMVASQYVSHIKMTRR